VSVFDNFLVDIFKNFMTFKIEKVTNLQDEDTKFQFTVIKLVEFKI